MFARWMWNRDLAERVYRLGSTTDRVAGAKRSATADATAMLTAFIQRSSANANVVPSADKVL
jgi:hypothetical protein